jgi:hypothetical protein
MMRNANLLPYGHPMKTGRLFGYRSGAEAEELTAYGDKLIARLTRTRRRDSGGRAQGGKEVQLTP